MTIHVYSETHLATLDVVKAELNAAQGANYQGDDALLFNFIADATAMAHQYCMRAFVPYRQTRYYDADGDLVDDRWLALNADLLEVISITNGDGETVTGDQYILRDRNRTPYQAVVLKPSSEVTWSYEDGDYEDAIAIEGIWGFHASYGTAWVDSGDAVQTGGLDASATTLDVADADGQDARFHTRFQAGQVLKIDEEFLKVVSVTAGETNQLTVRRGQLGTMAAMHDAGATITTYAPMRNIERAVTALAIWLYRNKATQGENVHFLADGTTVIEDQAPSNIKETLAAYRWQPWGF